MAGQGVNRRRILKILGTAAAAAQVPVFSKWGFASGRPGDAVSPNTASIIRPAVYNPQFFTPPEYAMVERLTEIIIPTDSTPGAKEAGVAEFIDFMVANDEEAQYPFRTGVTWLDAYSQQNMGKKFLELSPEQQTSLLEPLGFKAKSRPGEEAGRKFFAMMREYTVTGFYTSEIGYKELDNPSLKFYAESPECPHTDDREHKHLTPVI
jgi:gluconate 2-dehydrogenase gamma chain